MKLFCKKGFKIPMGYQKPYIEGDAILRPKEKGQTKILHHTAQKTKVWAARIPQNPGE